MLVVVAGGLMHRRVSGIESRATPYVNVFSS